MRRTRAVPVAVALFALLAVITPARAEIIEQIVARVNDDPITQTDLRAAEQEAVEQIYSRKAGESLDKDLAKARTELLRDLITRRLLIQQAERLYDITKMQDAFIRQFKEGQKIATNAELERALKAEGYSLEEFKKKIIEVNAPASVINMEVRDKVSVSEAEVEAYYKDHAAELSSPDTVSFREIILKSDARSKDETLALARSLVERARAAGASFTDLAAEASEVDPKLRGVLLGPLKKGELAPALEAAAFSMKPGEVSDPIEVGAVVHIVRIETREASVTPPLDTLREKIYTTIEQEKFGAALDQYILSLWGRAEIHVPDEFLSRIPPDFRKFIK